MVNDGIPLADNSQPFEKWMWIELIGFDNEEPDYGVRRLIDRAGFVPDVLSLLMFNPDFVHTHDRMAGDCTFPADYCAYWGRARSGERSRQAWTKYQLKGLVDELHQKGAAVYFSVFDIFDTTEWVGQHPEILHVRKTGEQLKAICPWKHLADGAFYEDYFIRKALEVAGDYEFDGYHCADGYAHQRIPIYEGDFSDDMVGQFTEFTQVNLPETVSGPADDNAERIGKRADWIWRNRRLEWIQFHSCRIERFFKKLTTAFHGASRAVVVNTAWTKDPLEALYRYGVDYRKLADAGVDGFIAETAACAAELDGCEKISSYRALYPFETALMLIKAHAPETRIIFLNGIKDTTEQWDALRHSTRALEREIYELASFYSYDNRGKLKRCASGLMACLADDIDREEWDKLRSWWKLGFSAAPSRIAGATLVWSDQSFKNQLADYVETRRWTVHRLVHHLLARNAPVRATVDVNHLGTCEGAILIVYPHLFPEDELRRIQAYRKGAVIFIGAMAEPIPGNPVSFDDAWAKDTMFCGVYIDGLKQREFAIDKEASPSGDTEIRDPSGPHAMFYYDLYFRNVSENFLKRCVETITACSTPVRILDGGKGVCIAAFEESETELRVLAGNDNPCHVTGRIDVGRKIHQADVLTGLPARPIQPEGSAFSVRIPPRGAVMLRLKTD